MAATWVIGDIHGCAAAMRALLRRIGLVDAEAAWSGGDATLIFVGDFVDRGPDGLAVLDDVVRLEREAAAAGGAVAGLLGNHDAMFLGVRVLGAEAMPGLGQSFLELWVMNGGDPAELRGARGDQIAFLRSLPVALRVGDDLVVHADSSFYLDYGGSLAAVNEAVTRVMAGSDPVAWTELLIRFHRRRELSDPDVVDRMLAAFGGRRIIHGHTPIPFEYGLDPETVSEPRFNGDGRVVNVDGGLFLGSPGVALKLG